MIFFAGWLGQKIIGFDIRSISTVALYIMSPFLAFRTFYSNELTMDYIYIIVFCCLLTLVLIGVVLIVSFITKADRSQFSAMVLGSAFMNSGNYGAPVALFAFGATGFDYAVIVMVFQSFLMSSVGIFFASFGSKQKTSLAESVQSVIRMPVLHGAVIGVIFQLLHIPIPETISDAIGLVADASIPTVMLVLGMQLAEIRVKDVS